MRKGQSGNQCSIKFRPKKNPKTEGVLNSLQACVYNEKFLRKIQWQMDYFHFLVMFS